MVNPISPSPFAISADLTAPELPAAMTRAAIQVSPAAQSSKPETATGGSQSNQPGLSETPLEKTIEHLNNSMQAWATGMRFDIDEDAQRVVVSIVDSTSGEVLRTVPSDAVLRVAKMIVQLQGGSIDARA